MKLDYHKRKKSISFSCSSAFDLCCYWSKSRKNSYFCLSRNTCKTVTPHCFQLQGPFNSTLSSRWPERPKDWEIKAVLYGCQASRTSEAVPMYTNWGSGLWEAVLSISARALSGGFCTGTRIKHLCFLFSALKSWKSFSWLLFITVLSGKIPVI